MMYIFFRFLYCEEIPSYCKNSLYDNTVNDRGIKGNYHCAIIHHITNFTNNDSLDFIDTRWVCLKDTITIQEKAFFQMTHLNVVVAPQVKYIFHEAFALCPNLEKVEAQNLLFSGNSTFENCKMLKEAMFPMLEYIAPRMFYGCSSLTKFKCNAIKVYERAFYKCESIVNLQIPSVAYIYGNEVFGKMVNMKTINMSDLQMADGENIFIGCYSLTTVYIFCHLPSFSDINTFKVNNYTIEIRFIKAVCINWYKFSFPIKDGNHYYMDAFICKAQNNVFSKAITFYLMLVITVLFLVDTAEKKYNKNAVDMITFW